MVRKEFQQTYGKIIEKILSDTNLRENLMADPTKVFKANGIPLPTGFQIKMHKNTEDTVHFILPFQESNELSLEQLDQVCGGCRVQSPNLYKHYPTR